VPTHFKNVQKGSLKCKYHGTLQIRHQVRFTVKFSLLSLTNLSIEGASLTATWGSVEQFEKHCGLNHGDRLKYQVLVTCLQPVERGVCIIIRSCGNVSYYHAFFTCIYQASANILSETIIRFSK